MKRLLILLTVSLLSAFYATGQSKVGIKTNLLYGVGTFTPNLGLELGLGKHTTLDISGSYNGWNVSGESSNNKKLAHWLIQPEFRYFLCERFNGHFFGIHALYGQYNIGEHNLPMLFGKRSNDYRFQGDAYGAGLSYGYQLILGRRWNLEFNLGLGYLRMQYSQYDCPTCGQKVRTRSKNYFGPTKAGISLIYIIK